jgi:phosphoglycerate dehydrogenase-like enzyme
MPGAARSVVLSWVPDEVETDFVQSALPGDVKLHHPRMEETIWSRFDCRPEALGDLLLDADALIGWTAPSRQGIARAHRLKFIAWLHAGCDQLDLPLLAERGIKVANVRGANGVVVAEHALALLLGLAKRVRQNDEDVREVRWHGWWEPEKTSVELLGSTVCVAGYGTVGQAVARLCAGLGMQVLAIRRSGRREEVPDTHVTVGGPEDAKKLLSLADFIVLALPLTPETRGFIDAEKLSWLKPGAYLINIGRGPLVEERDLHEALTGGRLAGFASDVWWNYADAMPPGYHFAMPSRLGIHRLPNVLGSGDAAANVLKVKERMITLGLESLAAFLKGQTIPRLVDLRLGY